MDREAVRRRRRAVGPLRVGGGGADAATDVADAAWRLAVRRPLPGASCCHGAPPRPAPHRATVSADHSLAGAPWQPSRQPLTPGEQAWAAHHFDATDVPRMQDPFRLYRFL